MLEQVTLMGIVHNVQGLYAARFFLGVAESGFFPGATYLLTVSFPSGQSVITGQVCRESVLTLADLVQEIRSTRSHGCVLRCCITFRSL